MRAEGAPLMGGAAPRGGGRWEKGFATLRAVLNSPWLTLFLFTLMLFMLSRRRDVRLALARAFEPGELTGTPKDTTPDPLLAVPSPSLTALPPAATLPSQPANTEEPAAEQGAAKVLPVAAERSEEAAGAADQAAAATTTTEAAEQSAPVAKVEEQPAVAAVAAVQSAAVAKVEERPAVAAVAADFLGTTAAAQEAEEKPKPRSKPQKQTIEGLPADCTPRAGRTRHVQYCRTSVATRAECGTCPGHSRCTKQKWCCSRYVCTCSGRYKVPVFSADGSKLLRCTNKL